MRAGSDGADGDATGAMDIEAFLRSIRERRPPVVTGEDGLRALETAMRITELVQARRTQA